MSIYDCKSVSKAYIEWKRAHELKNMYEKEQKYGIFRHNNTSVAKEVGSCQTGKVIGRGTLVR